MTYKVLTAARPQGLALKHYAYLLLVLMLVASLAACGFKLRGASPLPFESLYTNISSQTPFGIQIIRGIRANSPQTRIVENAADAEVRLLQINNRRTRKEMSLNVDGKVEEYELGLYISFTLVDQAGNTLLEPTTLSNLRLLPYDEENASAKATEMQQLYADMERNIANSILQRITSDDVIQRYQALHKN
ncbi:LPS-assembly lipoprotein LptE [Oligella sp. MSHR50489EDL]|uniref:LPS-assembly lipoprotein LptE n=1 Tax=Oligella sp. MSHR50489EDL TaxID=3139409 RepID=UPI003D815C85